MTRSLLAAALLCLLAPLLAPPAALAQSGGPDLTISADETVFPESTAQNPYRPEVVLSASDVGGTATRLTLEPSLDGAQFTLGASSPSSGDRITATLSFVAPPDYENPTDTATPVGDVARDNIYLVDVTLNVRSGDQERPTETTRIRIRITPVDEYDPVLTNDRTHLLVNENERRFFVQFHSTDADADGGPIRHEIVDDPVASPDRAHFRLVVFGAAAAVLFFKSPPDYEAPNDEGRDNIYNITVRATSGSPPRTSEPLALTIEIRDRRGEESVIVNTRGEVAQNRKYEFRTGYAGVIDTFTIEGSDADEMFSFGPLGVFRGDTNLSSFRFNPSSGELSFSGPAPNATSNLRLSATNTSGRTILAHISVRANRRAVSDSGHFVLPENSDSPQVQFTVTDPDDVPPRVRLFDLWDADLFTLESTSSGATVTATLRFKTQPDFENPIDTEATSNRFSGNPINDAARNNIYLVRIGISEEVGGDDFVGGAHDIRIVVTNIDDGPTLFPTEPTYEVPENTTEPIVTLRGADADADTLRFEIADGAASPDKDHFFLHPSTGVLRFASAQDYEDPSDVDGDRTYNITVQVASGNPSRTSNTQMLKITLINDDDNDPTIAPIQATYNLTGTTGTIATFTIVGSDADETRTFGALEAAPGSSLTNFNFDTASGVLSFAEAATAGTSALIIRATSNSKPAMLAITIRASDGLALDTPANQNYTQGTAIPDLPLPVATGGTGTLQYTLTQQGGGALPGGLTFTADTRTLSGTPDAAGTTTLTYTVSDANNASTNATFTVIVNVSLTLTASGDQNYTQGRAITDLELPAATGGTAPLTYTLTNVPGLTFTADTRTLSGTPSTPATTTLTYTVTDANGASENATFMVIVNAGLALSARGNHYTQGTAITDLQLPAATGGTAPLTYTLTSVPGGLTFTADTRILSGTPNTAGTTTLTYEVTDANGASTSVNFTVIVSDGLALSARGNQNYTLGTAITALELPEARGGREPLTYTLTGLGDSALPGDLLFTVGTRTLSGTPNTAGTTILTYEVSDANNASTIATFIVIVSDSLALTASGNQNYTQGRAITDLELPAATGGTAPLTYTLTSVPGLEFDADTRTLSGTPSTADTTTLTYEVTDTNNASTSVTFTVIVNASLTLDTPANQNYTQGTAITLQLPVATGGRAPTYTLTGPGDSALPAGLTFTANTRILSGTPNTAATTTLTYRVTDTNGASMNTTFTVTVNASLTLDTPANQNYTQGTAITLQLPVATGGTAPLTYTLTGPGGLPGGLEFDADTRTLSGTLANTASTFDLTYEVTDANGASTNATFRVVIASRLRLSAPVNQNYTQGTLITGLELPEARGGREPLTYTLTGPGDSALPGGLTFTPGTRTLSGTPNMADTTTLTYEVTDDNGASTNATFTVIVSDGLTLTASGNQNYTQGTAITGLELPEARGGREPLTYTLTGPGDSALPGGLNFTPGTRTLSGTPNTADTTTLTYTVTDANGASENATFMVIVNVGLALSARGDQNYTLDTEIDDLTLPAATGGKAPLTYTLTSVPGLNFNANTRRLSGTPDTAGTTTLTYEVMDANGTSASVDFMVTVNASLALTASGNQNYTLGTTIPDLQLPAATGGTAPLTYTLFRPGDGALPGGLNFNANTRTLSGTPTTAGASALTYRVTDANGANTSVGFTVIVNASLALTALGNQNYTQGAAITALTLPAATGGTAPLTYTLTRPGGLPGGLEFDADTRTLSGTLANTASTFDLTYEVTDDNGASTNATFRVVIASRLRLSAPVNQNYTQGTAITGLELPEATGGREPLTYTLTGPGDLPGGLEFDADTRTLSGTPNTAGTTTLTYEVTDTNNASTSVDFTVTVNASLALDTPDDQNYTMDTAITALSLPMATGGTEPLTYTLTGPGDSALPNGLTFTATTRVLSGTPNTAATTTLTYRVTDDNGASTSVDFMVTVNASLTLDTPDDQNYTLDTAITGLPLPAATGGTAPLVYTLTGPGGLPGGLEFDADTRTLSGTPANTASTFDLTYEVTDDNGASTNATFRVVIASRLRLSAPVNQNYTQGTAITGLELPEARGGREPLTYTLTGPGDSALPGGLTFTPNTRTLSGTPSTADTTTLTYMVTDTNGASTSVDFTVTVNASLTLDTPVNQNYTQDTAITALSLPMATGGTEPLTYTLTGPGDSALPNGLTFTATTRVLSGTPSTADTTTLTYMVTDTNGASTSVDFTVTVNASLTLDTPDDQNYTMDTAITALSLPMATGGTEPLTYTLTGPGDSALPNGLTFTATTRVLSGTPNTAATTTLTYRVTDDNGASTSVDFMVTVNASLTLDTPDDQNYTLDTAITGLELPVATGGTGTLTYTLTGPGDSALPGGLTFTAGTRTLSGTPSMAATTTLTYEVTDANGASTSATFTVTVSDGLAFSARGNQNYTQGTAINNLPLPVATGGTAPLTYTLTSVPGLTFNAGTRTLSGTPNTAATTTLTYEVTDANGASTSVTFTVTVNASLALTASGNQIYTMDTAITALSLPMATGGTAPLTYTLTSVPGGLNFTPGTRTLSGTPNTADTTTLTYEVSDANNASTTATFMVTVNASLTLTAPANQNYTRGTAITDLELPVAAGGTAPLTYTLTSVPGGLNFNANNRTLSGTPSTADTTTLTYEVTDDNGASTTATFTVIVNASLALDTPANQNYTRGTAITALELPVAAGGTAPLTYTLTRPGGLPGGLEFDPGTRTLSGTPNTADTTTLTYRVTDANGANTSVDFTVTVSDGLALSARGNQNYTQGTAINNLPLPAATGGTEPLTYTLTGPGDSALPGGLTFTAGTRTLSGTPNTAGTTTLTYEVTDTNGASTSATFTVTVNASLTLTASGNQNYTLDTAIPGLPLPAATGGTAPLQYTLTRPGGLPGGLNFNTNTRTLSGTPSTAGTTTLTYEVSDANGANTSVDFTVTVSDGLALTASGDQNYTQGRAITDLQLPEATGGTGTLTYTLIRPGDSALPRGLNFDAGTRTLSGTPNTADTTTLTYEVSDANGASTSVDFRVVIASRLRLSARGDQNYTQGRAITGLQLPVASGGTAPLTYTLTGPGDSALPGGLTFTPGTRTLSGTPTSRASTTTLTYRVTDTNGASENATFRVVIASRLRLSARGDQNYTQGRAITGLQLPVASGGREPLTYTLTGPDDGNLPGGLTFDTRTLSGTPNTPATTSLTYEVTDTNGASTSVDFTVTVNASLTLTASGNQNYTQGTLINNLQLPVATGGTEPLTYTLIRPGDSALPGGLNFNANTRTLSGTPTTAGASALTYRVSDANNASTRVLFVVTVNASLTLTASGNQNYTLDTAITGLELPVATGGTAPLTYTLTGPGDSALPAGLNFTPGTRTLSGTPNAAATTTLTYEVTDANGASTSATFTVTVNASLTLTASGNQNYTLDTAIPGLPLPAATGGTAPLTYTLTRPGGLPGGLEFDPGTRTLSGTPNTAGTTTLTYRVTDANGANTSVDFTVTVSDGLALSARGNQNYTQGTAINNLPLPAATGGTEPLTYTLTGLGDSALPGGLTFTAGTRTLSGTPNTADTTTLTYEVMDANGANTSVDFTVTVNASLTLTASGNQNYTLDTAIPGLPLPAATGGTVPLAYTLTNVPGGLDFDPGTRTLSGTPDTAATTTLTYEVMDANGASTSVDFTVTVNASLTLTASGDQNYTLDTAITGLTLPAATGGTAPLAYTLTSVPGLEFDADTRILSGTPSTAATTILTYEVTDTNGASTTATFTVIVSDSLALTAPANQNYTRGTAITALTLPVAAGGTAPLTYTLTSVPGGLNFNANTRTLSGTPTTAGTTTLTYRVSDANGASTSVDFMVIVNASLALDTPANQNYTRGTAITDLELPVAAGGTVPLTYTLASVPGGLTFTPATRTLSGTPDTDGNFTLTYRVTDDNGASTSVDFMVIVNASLVLDTPDDQNYTMDTAITDLTLDPATGGTTPVTYTLTGPSGAALATAIPGLNFDANNRTLSGTPTTTDTTELTYTATDDNGSTAMDTFTVTVADEVEVTAPGDQTYTMDTAITDLALAPATGGTGTVTYTLAPLPNGLIFNETARVLSGTPTAMETVTATYTATDDNGSTAMDTFTVIVAARVAVTAPNDQTYTMDTAITALSLPMATGGTTPVTYTLAPLPNGLTFTATTRVLSGTPTTTDTTELTYTATDDNGASTSVDFTVTVNASLTLTASGDQNYTLDTAITALPLPEATGGTAPLTYTLTSVPGGLTFTPATRTLSGTPDTDGNFTLTYRVTDDNGASTSVDFMVIVNASLALDTPANQNYTLDTAITALPLPAATGGTEPLTYTLTSVPGLEFDADTRILSGTPDTDGNFTLTYRVTDDNGASTNATFTVTVNASLTLSTSGHQNYTQGTAIPDLELPEARGGTAPLTYTLTGLGDSALPGGLIFDIDTRMLSGTPNMPGTTTLTYRVTDANGASTTATFTVIVSDSLTLTASGNQNYTRGTAITALELPEATGGTGTPTYTLTGPGDSALPAGLDFNADTRTLSGTPSTAATTTLTYTVTDANGASTTATFMVTVNASLTLTASGDQNYTLGTAITALELPVAAGGTAPLTYTLTSVLGLSF